MSIRDYIENSIIVDEKLLKYYNTLSESSYSGRLNSRYDKRRKKTTYYIKHTDEEKEHYVKPSNINRVWKLQQKRLGEEMVKILKHNIQLKKDFCRMFRSDDITTVVNSLPKSYRPDANTMSRRKKQAIRQSENPYHRENLVELTSFGLYVRSKGELAIAELLHALGIRFYYERELVLDVPIKSGGGVIYMRKVYYPDFTIILPGGIEIFWEHRGMMNSSNYVEKNIEKERNYNLCGIYQPHNLIVTAEGPDNDMDMEAIKRIINGVIMPLL